MNAEEVEIVLEKDINGLTGLTVDITFKASVQYWNKICGMEMKFPNGIHAKALQPILDYSSNYDQIKGIRFFPLTTAERLSGKKGDKIIGVKFDETE